MGSLKSLLGAIPGIRNLISPQAFNENTFRDFEVMVPSMTPKERANPSCFDRHRRLRIACGSGLGEEKVNQLFKQFDKIRQLTKKEGHKKYLAAMMGKK